MRLIYGIINNKEERIGEKMKVDEQVVKEIGSVMKLKFTEDEIKEFTIETNKTLSLLEKLGELDTEGVEGTFYGTVTRKAAFRADEAVQNKEEVAALLEIAPHSVDQLIQVPAILDNGEGGA